MKTFLAVIGTIAVVALLALGIGGYWVYRNAGSKMAEVSNKEIEKFIQQKKPTENVVAAIRRLQNAAKLQKKAWVSMYLSALPMGAIEDGVVTDEEISLLNEGSQLGEKGEINNDQFAAFSDKVGKVIPRFKSNTPRR